MSSPSPPLSSSFYSKFGFISAAAAIALDAFGAHVLKSRVSAEHFKWWEIAVHYQMVHSLALGLAPSSTAPNVEQKRFIAKTNNATSKFLFTMGISMFSGSLYALVLTKRHEFAYVTPFGGATLVAAWLSLVWTGL